MTTAVVVEPEAVLELREAAAWYERERAGLGLELVDEVTTVLSSLAQSVAVALAVPGTRAALQLRRVMVARFPYAVVFLSLDDVVHVIAVAHLRRRPNYWAGRLRRVLGSVPR
jgi:hypothetical protein